MSRVMHITDIRFFIKQLNPGDKARVLLTEEFCRGNASVSSDEFIVCKRESGEYLKSPFFNNIMATDISFIERLCDSDPEIAGVGEGSCRNQAIKKYTQIDSTLDARQKTHGDFKDVSDAAQALKEVMRSSENWDTLTVDKKECLEMCASKIARILSGNPDDPDHWHDIIGYVRLVEKTLG